jgi:ComF family protein
MMAATLIPRVRSAAAGLADLLLPIACVSCGRCTTARDRGIVCGVCWSRVRALPEPQCTRCGHPLHGQSCAWCPLLLPAVRAARSWCWVPRAVSSAIVRALKYDGWEAVADEIAERLARLSWPADVVDERAMVVPVPLAPQRLRERGFNQSELIARALSRRWQIPMRADVLERVRATRTQTRLTPDDRRHNVAGAFRAAIDARTHLRGAHVVLLDDVITTAATLNACADALLASGARIVSYVTFGRAPAIGDRRDSGTRAP